MNLPTQEQTNAALRHAVTYIAGIGTALGFVAMMLHTQIDVQGAADAMKQVLDGITQATGGLYKLAIVLGPIVAVISGWFSQRSAKPENQAQNVAARIDDPAVKAAVVPAVLSKVDEDPTVRSAAVQAVSEIEGVSQVRINPARAKPDLQRLAADQSVNKVTS